ncbi:hypothetical protein ACWKT3_00040 [Streptomyces violaceus]
MLSSQSIEVRFGTSRAGAVDVALYTTTSVYAVVVAHPEVGSDLISQRGALVLTVPRAVSTRVCRA